MLSRTGCLGPAKEARNAATLFRGPANGACERDRVTGLLTCLGDFFARAGMPPSSPSQVCVCSHGAVHLVKLEDITGPNYAQGQAEGGERPETGAKVEGRKSHAELAGSRSSTAKS